MLELRALFPEVARHELLVLRIVDHPRLPAGDYAFMELFCDEARCDCRRVLLPVWTVSKRQVATINYAFDPVQPPPFEDEPQIFLDPGNPQSELSEDLLDAFKGMLRGDPDVHDRLVRHYVMWKGVVDDPRHPLHGKVRNASHDDPSFRPAYPLRVTSGSGAKVGRNDPCPCGSGKKHQKCCGSPTA